MNFNISGTKSVAIGGLPEHLKENNSLREALNVLIRGLPETSDVNVTVDGTLGDDNQNHTLTIVVTTVHKGTDEDRRRDENSDRAAADERARIQERARGPGPRIG